jgi:hypothetical protein
MFIYSANNPTSVVLPMPAGPTSNAGSLLSTHFIVNAAILTNDLFHKIP